MVLITKQLLKISWVTIKIRNGCTPVEDQELAGGPDKPVPDWLLLVDVVGVKEVTLVQAHLSTNINLPL